MKSKLLLIMLLFFIGCSIEDEDESDMNQGDQYMLEQGGMSKPTRQFISPDAILRFALQDIPAITGYDQTAGMLDTFIVYNNEVMFSAIIYNSSLTEKFHVDTTDAYGEVPNIFRAELLTMGGKVLQTAAKTSFCICETRPIQEGYPPSEEFHTLNPQWADDYPYNTDGQCFMLAGLRTGKYQIRYTLDPAGIYGQYQWVVFTVIYDGQTVQLER